MRRTALTPTTRRFEAGTPPVPNCYAAEAGIGLIRAIGIPAIEARIRERTGETMDRLTAADCTLATPRDDARRGPQVAIRSKNAAAMTERLVARGVVVSWREDKVRAMFHAYNNAPTSTPWWKGSPPTATCWRDAPANLSARPFDVLGFGGI